MLDLTQVNVIDMKEALARAAEPTVPFVIPPPPVLPVPAILPVLPAPTVPRWTSAADLCAREFPPVQFIVQDYIAEGLTLLAGKPKVGKSWLAMEIGLAVATGTVCLGNVKCEQGDVLYLALEDNERRLDSRIKKVWTLEMMAGRPIPPNLYLSTEWPRSNAGGIAGIRQWIAAHPAARLVIIDVLAMFKSVAGAKDSTLYEADYLAIKELHAVAMQTGVGIIVIHHTRKSAAESDPFEKVSGTLGLSGAADSTVILDRDQNGTTLYGRGRDIEEFERAIQFDKFNCRWKALGDAAEVRRTDERGAILSVLTAAIEPMNPNDIANATDMKRNNVDRLLGKMAMSGEVLKAGRGKYVHPDRTELLTADDPRTAGKNGKKVRNGAENAGIPPFAIGPNFLTGVGGAVRNDPFHNYRSASHNFPGGDHGHE